MSTEAWNATWRELGCAATPALLDVHRQLLASYAQPHRHYHTNQHLGECFALWQPARELAVRPAEVDLALWFHDAVYDVYAHDNELRSAQWAQRVILDQGLDDAEAERVFEMILATRHEAAAPTGDAEWLIDIDLSILGAERTRFDEYETQIRAEYAHVPEPAYRHGRSQILQAFLARPAIYSTRWFSARLETRARENLKRSIERLAE